MIRGEGVLVQFMFLFHKFTILLLTSYIVRSELSMIVKDRPSCIDNLHVYVRILTKNSKKSSYGGMG